jgi:hypothetical protein
MSCSNPEKKKIKRSPMKKMLGLGLLFFCLFAVSNVFAESLDGEVIKVADKGIIEIAVEGEFSLASGDSVELVYMAGMLPMFIGKYEVSASNENSFISKPIHISVPPSEGMKVQIDVFKKDKSIKENTSI